MRAIVGYLVHDRIDPAFMEYDIQEIKELAHVIGFDVDTVVVQKRQPDVKYFMGEGKVRELSVLVQEKRADAVIFNEELSPRQVRALEPILEPAQVWDRTQVILEIFKRRAVTKESKLQVELARLNYLYPRLYGLGGVMSRLGGGIGTRGPGETKLEVLKRVIRRRINRLEEQLSENKRRRIVTGIKRQKGTYQVSIVGYTNAGKSTLLNALSKTTKPTYADANVFATLDTRYRRFAVLDKKPVVLVDTVGFVNFMPEKVLDAFKSTLEVIQDSDLILHVLDLTSPIMDEQESTVLRIINELGAGDEPIIKVYNKLDAYDGPLLKDGISISALDGTNLDTLKNMIVRMLKSSSSEVTQ
ncbi:GTPase HflX [Coprothermobacter platensis]|jgi:GTP-binding protein HflX|uniref:GTPase HflX n=1 Tax=Coprothermobacter platensis TaxID=108819 RepID=UPI000361D812|nr:GTPase HflX [Coprothermobacter platensis]